MSTTQCEREGVTRDRRAALRRAGALVPVVRGVHDVAAAGGQVGDRVPGGTGAPHLVGREPDHLRRRAAWTALLALGPERAVAVGCCALALLGVQGLPASIRPEASLPSSDGRRLRTGEPARGAATRAFRTGAVHHVSGARVVSPELALAQAVCELDREHAVAVLDSALQRGLLAESDLHRVRALARGRRGAARLADWWHLVDGRAQSPLETRARLQCVDAGIPPHDVQVPVRDRTGRVVARGDLGWIRPDGRLLVVEIDGAGPHSTPAALYEDRRRQNAVVGTGAVLLRFTAADVRTGHVVASTVRRHLAGAAG